MTAILKWGVSKWAISKAMEGNTVTVVADDTDILLLLIYHWTSNMGNIYFRYEAKTVSSKEGKKVIPAKTLCIKTVKSSIKPEICQLLLVAHAFTGCDATSRIHHVGKATFMKKLEQSEISL